MQLKHYKAALAAVWILALCTLGLIVGVTSVPSVVVFAAAALLPPILMLRLWHEPVETMSESIRQARR